MYIIEAVKYLAELAKDGKGSNRKVKWIEVHEPFVNDFVSGTVMAIRADSEEPIAGMVTFEIDLDVGGISLSVDQPIEIVWSET